MIVPNDICTKKKFFFLLIGQLYPLDSKQKKKEEKIHSNR